MIGIDFGSTKGWRSSAAIGALSAHPVLLFLYIFVELKLAVEPLTPGHIIFQPIPVQTSSLLIPGAVSTIPGCLFCGIDKKRREYY